MTKFVSQWNRNVNEFTFPPDMPKELREKVIRRRRQIMTYSYIANGIGGEFADFISQRMFTKLSKDLEELQAAWGNKFGFYDFLFDKWKEEQEDHLITNNGVDSGVVNYAIKLMQKRKLSQLEAQRSG